MEKVVRCLSFWCFSHDFMLLHTQNSGREGDRREVKMQ